VDLHVQPAARPQLDLQASVMSHGNRADDGQPEPVAVRVTGLAIAESLERLEELFDLIFEHRRALGASKGHIRIQFLTEAILLALLGGVAGIAAGAVSTAVYASTKGWAVVVPALAWGGGLGAALAIGGLAGLLPALRAARMSPTEALWAI
jgi:putative ABC transport system permease protein